MNSDDPGYLILLQVQVVARDDNFEEKGLQNDGI